MIRCFKEAFLHIFIILLCFALVGCAKGDNPGVNQVTVASSKVSAKAIDNKVQEEQPATDSGKGYKEDDIRYKRLRPVSLHNKEEKSEKLKDLGIPVLMYHSIGYEKGNELRIPKEKFYEQMKFLKDNGYNTVSLDELYSYMLNGEGLPDKPIVITFDDGYEDNYAEGYPILKQLNLKATVFVITGWVDKNPAFLTLNQMRDMDNNGVDIESHTVNHDQLDLMKYEDQLKTLKESKEFLENNLHKNKSFIAYPFGKFNKDTIKAMGEAGYTMAFTTMPGPSKRSNGILTLNRERVSASMTIEQFRYLISQHN